MTSLAGRKPRLASRPARLSAAPKRVQSFYRSPEWRALVAKLIAKRGRRCEDCCVSGCRVYADHVVELQDGGAALDEANLKLLCAACHGQKTERQRRERAGLA